MNNPKQYDLFIIGGGINGCGIANDASGRGMHVGLCEMNDIASATSSGSSKLIHGGLRYLEYMEFRLVQEALKEREILIKKAPHLVKPLRFILPHQKGLRPAWFIRVGLYIYDHLSKLVTLKSSESIKFGADSPLLKEYEQGFEYSDAFADDSRLVISNAIQAREQGAQLFIRHKCISTKRYKNYWDIEIQDSVTKKVKAIQTKVLINATGPWVSQYLDSQVELTHHKNVALVQGSHIITQRLHKGDEAFILQNDDERIIFVIPYLEKFSLIGTTDKTYSGDPSKVVISEEEIEYLINAVNRYFKKPISKQDIVASYAAIRPLMEEEEENPQAITRDYSFELNTQDDKAALLSIFGGKLTTYRKLAEAALKKLHVVFPDMSAPWTEQVKLPGSEYESTDQLYNDLHQSFPWINKNLLQRYITNYGSMTWNMLINVKNNDDMGIDFGHGLHRVEIDYLIEHEWAFNSEDILYRRTKHYLLLDQQQVESLESYIATRIANLHAQN